MWIDVRIPYEPRGKLAFAYNRALENTLAPWVLLLDHDVFLALNPHWYDVCLKAIARAEEIDNVGMLTCVMNGCEGRVQDPGIEITKTPDLDVHVDVAQRLYETHGSNIYKADTGLITGFFMLVNRRVAQEVGFRDQGKGVNKVDHNFASRLRQAGYKIYVMKGLYVYHRQRVRKLQWNN